MTEQNKLEPGNIAPKFELANQAGKFISLSKFEGKKVVLYFYPAASTPACTKEATDFRDEYASFVAAGYEVIGVSPDAVSKISKFHNNQNLNFDLLSDEDLHVHQQFAAYGEKNLYGRKYVGALRSTFVIDEHGKVELALYNVKATGHVAMLKKLLKL